MTLLSWVEIVLFVLKAIPEIIVDVQKLLVLVHGSADTSMLARVHIAEAIESGNVSQVKEAIQNCVVKCQGVGCSSDLAKE